MSGGTFTEATDVFGLGCVLFAAATRRCPGAGGDARDQMSVRAQRRLPAPLAEAIDSARAEAPADRPTVRELAASCAAAAG
jgi:hypothetical protein